MQNNLRKRGNRYYFRRRIPLDLVAHYGKEELSYSLNTSDYALAKVLASAETTKTDAEFIKIRARRAPSESTRQAADAATARAMLERAEWFSEYTANREYHKETDARIRQATAVQEATGELKSAPVPLYPHETEKPASEGKPKTLRHVVPSWTARTRANNNAIGRMNKALDLFEEACGPVPVKELAKSHGATFVKFLLDAEARGFQAKTAHNHASNITALLNVAVKDDLLDVNLLDLAFDKNADAQKRRPWTDAELARMFSSPLFSGEMDTIPAWQGVKPTDGRALLLILQHTGARIGEIAQLRRGDFLTRGGVVCICITAEAGTVKTAESERTVPLADHLLADTWFSSWLAGIMDGKQPGAPAFPSMAGRARGPADTAVQWFHEFRKATKLPLGRLEGAHKFRHWVRSALAAKGVGDATADSITGHAAQGSSGRVVYTAAASLPVMLEALNRLTYPKISGTSLTL